MQNIVKDHHGVCLQNTAALEEKSCFAFALLQLHCTCIAIVQFSFAATKIGEHLQIMLSAQLVEDFSYF
jgi:hypothetical protein